MKSALDNRRCLVNTLRTALLNCLNARSRGLSFRHHAATCRQHRGCVIPQAVTQSLVLLKMGKIISRNMLSWLELLISRYCCI